MTSGLNTPRKNFALSNTKLGLTVAVITALLLIPAALLYINGFRAFVVTTPSMGEYAPVGTLVFSHPTNFDDVEKGDTLLFHQPQNPADIYFHRVIDVTADGLSTQGDINDSKDPWQLVPADVIGAESFHIVGLGWLVKALPYYLIGAILLHTLTRFYLPRYLRFPILVVGYELITSISLFLIKPLVATKMLGQTVNDGVANMKFVTTGIFPLDTIAVGGNSTILRPGEVGTVTTDLLGSDGYYHAEFIPSLTLGQIILLTAVCLLPLMLNSAYVLIARKKGWDLENIPIKETAETEAEPEKVSA